MSIDLHGRKIAFVHRGAVFGGAEESMLFNARDFITRGAAVSILSFGTDDLVRRFQQEGVSVVAGFSPTVAGRPEIYRRTLLSLECRLKGINGSGAAGLLARVCRREISCVQVMLREHQTDILYCNMGAAHDSQFIGAATAMGVATVSHQRREPPVFAGNRLLAEMNANCSAFVSNSEWTKTQWVRAGLRAEEHDVIYNTILPLPSPSGPGLRKRLGLPPASRLVASIGRLAGEKQFEWGIRAFAAVAAEFPDWHYVIIGGGEQLEPLRHTAGTTEAGSRIHFTGEIRAAAGHLDEVDVLLHPNPEEPFGRVVAEAMLAGRVVVGHASGGVPEMITDGQNGFLFESQGRLPSVLRGALQAAGSQTVTDQARSRIESLCGRRNSERLAGVLARVLEADSGPTSGRVTQEKATPSPS